MQTETLESDKPKPIETKSSSQSLSSEWAGEDINDADKIIADTVKSIANEVVAENSSDYDCALVTDSQSFSSSSVPIKGSEEVEVQESHGDWSAVIVSTPPDVIGSTISTARALFQSTSPVSKSALPIGEAGHYEIMQPCPRSVSFACESVASIDVPVLSSVPRASQSKTRPTFAPPHCLLLPCPAGLRGKFQLLLAYNLPDTTFKVFYREVNASSHLDKLANAANLPSLRREESSATDESQSTSSQLLRGFQSNDSADALPEPVVYPQEPKVQMELSLPASWKYLTHVNLHHLSTGSLGAVSCVAYAGMASGESRVPGGMGDVVLVVGSRGDPVLHTISVSMKCLYAQVLRHHLAEPPRAVIRADGMFHLLSSSQLNGCAGRGIRHLTVLQRSSGVYTSNATCIFSVQGCANLFKWSFPLLSSSFRDNREDTDTTCVMNALGNHPVQLGDISFAGKDSAKSLVCPSFLTCHASTQVIFSCRGAAVELWDSNGTLLGLAELFPRRLPHHATCVHPFSGLPSWWPWMAFVVGYSDGVVAVWLAYNRNDCSDTVWPTSTSPVLSSAVATLLFQCYSAETGKRNKLKSDSMGYLRCVPVLIIGHELAADESDVDHMNSHGAHQSVPITSLSLSEDWNYIYGGRMDGSCVQWSISEGKVP